MLERTYHHLLVGSTESAVRRMDEFLTTQAAAAEGAPWPGPRRLLSPSAASSSCGRWSSHDVTYGMQKLRERRVRSRWSTWWPRPSTSSAIGSRRRLDTQAGHLALRRRHPPADGGRM